MLYHLKLFLPNPIVFILIIRGREQGERRGGDSFGAFSTPVPQHFYRNFIQAPSWEATGHIQHFTHPIWAWLGKLVSHGPWSRGKRKGTACRTLLKINGAEPCESVMEMLCPNNCSVQVPLLTRKLNHSKRLTVHLLLYLKNSQT